MLAKIIVKTIREMFRLEIVRLALYTGVPIALIWMGLGWLLWEPVTALTTHFVNWLPFSMIRANGSFLILFFVWFTLVLISYALFAGLFGPVLFRHERFEILNFTSIVAFAILWAVALFLAKPLLEAKIEHLLSVLPFQTVAEGIASLLGLFLFYNLFLATQYLIVLIFKDPFIKAIVEIDYPHHQSAGLSIKIFPRLLLDALFFLALMVLAIPLLFIPFLNLFIVWLLWAWFYRESAFLAVCSVVCEERDLRSLRTRKLELFLLSLTAALLNFIPIVSFFTPYFVMTLYLHWIMAHKEED